MKEKLYLAMAILLLPIEFELHRLGLTIMNEPDTYVFWVGFFISIISLIGLGLTSYFVFKTIKQIYNQSKK